MKDIIDRNDSMMRDKSWNKYNIPKISYKITSTQYFDSPLWTIQTQYKRARGARVGDLPYMKFCIDCTSRYSPGCKYCDLDGMCSYHGVDFENGHCPICGNTFQEDWDRYIAMRVR